MSEEARARLAPFFTTKASGKWTGLGLSVVNGIVACPQRSDENRKCARRGQHIPAQRQREDGSDALAGEPALPAGSGQHVLYVDDDEVLRRPFMGLLERAEYRVTTCATADKTMNTLRANPDEFALLITDYNMPGGTGLWPGEGRGSTQRQLSVVIASGFVSEELRRDAEVADIGINSKGRCIPGTREARRQALSKHDAPLGEN